MNKDTTVPHLPRMKAINESEYAKLFQAKIYKNPSMGYMPSIHDLNSSPNTYDLMEPKIVSI